jgi:hypothetical protein
LGLDNHLAARHSGESQNPRRRRWIPVQSRNDDTAAEITSFAMTNPKQLLQQALRVVSASLEKGE